MGRDARAHRVVGVKNLRIILSCTQQSLLHINGLIWVSEEPHFLDVETGTGEVG